MADWWNGLIGTVTFWDDENGDSAAVRARLEGLGERPYAKAAIAKLAELNEGGFDKETEGAALRDTYMNGLRDYLAAIPADKRYGELKIGVEALDIEGTMSPLLAKFDNAAPEVKSALMNAIVANPEFAAYLTRTGGEGLGGMLREDVLKDPQYAGPISDILNTIANKPGPVEAGGYDFDALDNLGEAAEAYFAEAEKDVPKDPAQAQAQRELVARRQRELLDAVKEAGGQIPAIMNLNPEMLMQFLHDLFNGDLDSAVRNLAGGLGITGGDLTDFTETMLPIAGIAKFMGQDYYDWGTTYGPQLMAQGEKVFNVFNRLTTGSRVEFNGNIAATAPAGAAGAGELESVADAGDAIPAGGEVIHTASLGYDMTYPELRYSAQATVGGRGLDDVAKLTDGNANAVIAGEENPGYADGTLVAAADLGRTRTFESNGLNMG